MESSYIPILGFSVQLNAAITAFLKTQPSFIHVGKKPYVLWEQDWVVHVGV